MVDAIVAPMTSPILSPEALKRRLGTPNLVLLDARSGADGHARYLTQHIPGALFVSGEDDLAAHPDDPKHGGRHPLPNVKTFAETLGRLGITPASEVVVYDDKAGVSPASRLWWMLRAIGHEKVSVLDGGLAAAMGAGILPAIGSAATTPTAPYPKAAWLAPMMTMEGVEAALASGSHLLVDARDPARYLGESEPIDPVAGHIPGTVNSPQSALLGENGRFLPAETLRARFDALRAGRPASELVAYCGSGVTACHLLLGMEVAGLSGAGLYVGSFSEWCRNDKPIATGPA